MDFALAKSNPCGKSGGVAGVSPAGRGSEQRSASEGKAFPSFISVRNKFGMMCVLCHLPSPLCPIRNVLFIFTRITFRVKFF